MTEEVTTNADEAPPLPTPEAPVPVANALEAAPAWEEKLADGSVDERVPWHLTSAGTKCTCPDIPGGGHSGGRTPEYELDGPWAAAHAAAQQTEKPADDSDTNVGV